MLSRGGVEINILLRFFIRFLGEEAAFIYLGFDSRIATLAKKWDKSRQENEKLSLHRNRSV